MNDINVLDYLSTEEDFVQVKFLSEIEYDVNDKKKNLRYVILDRIYLNRSRFIENTANEIWKKHEAQKVLQCSEISTNGL